MKQINLSRESFKLMEKLGDSVYRYQNQAIKVFPNHLENEIKQMILTSNKSFLKRNHVVVPRNFVYIDETLQGYSMPLIQGIAIDAILMEQENPKLTLRQFNNAYMEALCCVENISQAKILMRHLSPSKIVFDYKTNQFYFLNFDGCKKSIFPVENKNMDAFKKSVDAYELMKKMVKK